MLYDLVDSVICTPQSQNIVTLGFFFQSQTFLALTNNNQGKIMKRDANSKEKPRQGGTKTCRDDIINVRPKILIDVCV